MMPLATLWRTAASTRSTRRRPGTLISPSVPAAPSSSSHLTCAPRSPPRIPESSLSTWGSCSENAGGPSPQRRSRSTRTRRPRTRRGSIGRWRSTARVVRPLSPPRRSFLSRASHMARPDPAHYDHATAAAHHAYYADPNAAYYADPNAPHPDPYGQHAVYYPQGQQYHYA